MGADSLLPLGGSLGLEQQVPLPAEASHMPKNLLNKNCMTGVPLHPTEEPQTLVLEHQPDGVKTRRKKITKRNSVVCSIDWRKPWVYSPVLPKSGIVVLACNP